MGLIKYSRIYQTAETRKDNTYILQNTKTEEQLVISKQARKFLSSYKKGKTINLLPSNFFFVSELKKLGYWERTNNFVYICKDYTNQILSSLNIELTNTCNLNCVHCYGSFGIPQKKYEISLSQIENILNDLDILNTSDVTLTGGECFLVKDFQQIALTFLNHGINLWIMTNGVLFKKIKTFIQTTKDYHYSIKVSLDGLEKTHNKIRQKETAFDNVIKSLDFISAQRNIKLYISTVIMKDNLEEISRLKTFVENRYPKAIHSVDVIFASGNAKHDLSHCFNLKELQDLSTKYPMLFVSKEKNTNIGFYRCSAGISQATLKADGTLKICNIANDDIFYFKHNVFKKGLKKTWEDCGSNIEYFRNEERKNTSQCNHCPIKSSCNITDCRVFAWLMTESEKNSSPITCLMARKTYETTTTLL